MIPPLTLPPLPNPNPNLNLDPFAPLLCPDPVEVGVLAVFVAVGLGPVEAERLVEEVVEDDDDDEEEIVDDEIGEETARPMMDDADVHCDEAAAG